MLDKQIRTALGFSLGLLTGLLILQGCGEISGDFHPNQPPTVEIVNVPGDAYGVDTTLVTRMPIQVSQYNQPVVILSIAGATMLSGTAVIYAVAPTDPFIENVDYTIDYDAGTFTALSSGSMVPNSTYYVDFYFLIDRYYVFTYAPLIHWAGYDPDGFIDHYSYADVTDLTNPNFITQFRAAADPEAFILQHQNEVVWHDTTAMQARIFLLSAQGDTTEHLFFVKAKDDKGAVSSNIAFKTFYRTNNAPYNPQIKPLSQPDSEFRQHYAITDTLFCLQEITPLWQGISVNWKSSDPDDKSLYQIPLEYSYYLIKTPGDTVWAWSNPNWGSTQQLQIYGLETGSYTLSVWVRDDGYTLSAESATITFNVIRPTFQYHILVVDETVNSGIFEVSGDSINAFWQNLLASLEGQLESENYVMDGVDVRFMDNSDVVPVQNSPIPYALIGQYKLVILYSDDHIQLSSLTYRTNRNKVLGDYLDVGGRLWVEGKNLLYGTFGGFAGDNAFTSSDFLGKYMQLATSRAYSPLPATAHEFIGAISVTEGLPDLQVDSNKVKQINLLPAAINRMVLPEVDWFTRSGSSGNAQGQAVTLFTYRSITADTVATSPYVYNEDSQVAGGATPVQATILPLKSGLLAVYRVENVTKGVVAQISSFNSTQIIVTYPYNEPWSDSDVLEVDYKYDPISIAHLKPVALRYEAQPRVQNTITINGVQVSYYTYTLGFRTGYFAFPFYFMVNDQQQVETIAKDMLNWFFYPTLHWSL